MGICTDVGTGKLYRVWVLVRVSCIGHGFLVRMWVRVSCIGYGYGDDYYCVDGDGGGYEDRNG